MASVDTAVRGFPVQSRPARSVPTSVRSREALRLLQVLFVVVPFIAGLDKFTGLLVNWDQYLAPSLARLSPLGGHALMLMVGAVEMAAAVLVVVKPRIGGLVVAFWLWAIIANLLLIPAHFDIALRDFGLSLAALALARLSVEVS